MLNTFTIYVHAHNYSTAFVTLNLFHVYIEASFKFSIELCSSSRSVTGAPVK